MEYKMLFSPMKIGNCEIKNRIVMSPMLMGFGRFDGCVTEQLMDSTKSVQRAAFLIWKLK